MRGESLSPSSLFAHLFSLTTEHYLPEARRMTFCSQPQIFPFFHSFPPCNSSEASIEEEKQPYHEIGTYNTNNNNHF